MRFPRLLAALMLAAMLVPSVVSPVAADHRLTAWQAETRVIYLLNQQRAVVGLRPLRLDSRLMRIARYRSVDMAQRGYFAHQVPGGLDFWEMLNARSITWYMSGEILAWNNAGSLADAAAGAARQWRLSAEHHAMVLKSAYNYIGIGVAIASDGRKIFTGILLRGPDRTGAWARFNRVTSTASTSTRPTLSWHGADIRLSALTSGFRYFQIRRRVDGNTWRIWSWSTTRTSVTLRLYRGHRYEFQIRARDWRGNYGRWSAIATFRP